MELNEYQRRRLQKAQDMRERGQDPYPARCRRTHTIAQVWLGLPLPDEPVQVRGTVVEGEGGHDLVAGRDRLRLLDLPAGEWPQSEIACGGYLALSDGGRLALRFQEWGMALDETAFRLLSMAEARKLCLEDAGEVVLTGRLTGGIRAMGRLIFADLQDGSVIEREGGFVNPHIQLFLAEETLGEQVHAAFAQDFDASDFVQADGELVFTRMGQLSLRASAVRMLSKALSPPPEKFHGLTDVEKRVRERYADLLANEEVRNRFRKRALILRAIRQFLDGCGFLEVETPILQPIYGGAAARPFVTHHNLLDQQLYLRISFELYLKRLLVGMYDGVYEIGHDFRNEGVSMVHNPEFTQLEIYQAYTDYEGMMSLFEQMIAFVAREVLDTVRVVYQGHEIDLTPPWRRVPLLQAIQAACGIDAEAHRDVDSLFGAIREIDPEVEPKPSWGKLVDLLLSKYVEPALIQPTFLTDYPLELSPLAKRRPDRPDLVERFEGFVAGWELCNAFSEVNDPLDQEERFLAQGRDYEAGDEEAHPMDRDYINALMYGMPPAGGLGMGVDRLVMLLTDQSNIREVLLFPHVRPL